MGDKRKGGKRKGSEVDQKVTKEEDAIARFVRFNCPTKATMFEGNEVNYFTGSKAVDTLYESRKYGAKGKSPKFTNRSSAVAFLRILLDKGLFFRARKLVARKRDDKKEAKEKEDTSKSPKKRVKRDESGEKSQNDERDKKEADNDSEDNEEEENKKGKEEDEKKKRKIKLEFHQDQHFNDANDIYVWIFDPTPLYKQVIGALMVLGTIAGCLFPLWPVWLRQGVYYLSIAGLVCFGILFAVAAVRTVIFAIIWGLSMGRHKLWILPNLMEDCGFFESFQPWYTYEYCDGSGSKKKKGEKKKSDAKVNEKEKNIKNDKPYDFENDEKNGNDSDKFETHEDDSQAGILETVDIDESSPEQGNLRRRANNIDDDFVMVEG